jgi:hypothetical protein
MRLALPHASFLETPDEDLERVCSEAVTRLRDAGVAFVGADLGGMADIREVSKTLASRTSRPRALGALSCPASKSGRALAE